MTDADIEVVRANSAAFSARDVDGMLALFHPDATVVDLRRFGFGSFSGHDELRVYYQGIVSSALEMHERLDVLAAGAGVVAADCELRGILVTEPAGPEVSATYALVVRLREGRIDRLEVCEDADHALEVSGLRS